MRVSGPRSPYGTVIWSTAIGAALTVLVWLTGWWPVGVQDTETGTLPDGPEFTESELVEPPPEQWEPPFDEPDAEDAWLVTDNDPNSVVDAQPPRQRVTPIEFEPMDHTDGRVQPSLGERSLADPREPRVLEFVPDDIAEARPMPRPVRPVSAERSPFEPSEPFGEEDDEPGPQRFERTAAKPTPTVPPAILDSIDELIRDREFVEAHRELSRIWWEQPRARTAIRERIERMAKVIFFDPQPHFLKPYEIQPNDTLGKIGALYDVPWRYLVRLNRVDPRRIRSGAKLKVLKGPFHARVDLSDFTLTVHNHGYFVKQFRVGIGADDRTPLGEFTVKNKVVNPQYTDPNGRVIDSDDPTNPIGERWIDIGGGFGIHGTIEPDSIGKAESAGCVRLTNDDVAELFDLLDLGSKVVIHE